MKFPTFVCKLLRVLRRPTTILLLLGLLLLASRMARPSGANPYGLSVFHLAATSAPAKAPEFAPADVETTYIASLSGTKYHLLADCPALKSAREVLALPTSEAEKEGYTPCQRCSKKATEEA